MKTINATVIKEINVNEVKTSFINDYIIAHSEEISDYIHYKRVTKEQAIKELREWLNEILEYAEFDIYDEERTRELFQEEINKELDSYFLSVELDKYDFNEKEITLDLWVAFGGPTYYFIAVYDEHGFKRLKDSKEDLKEWLGISDMLAIHEIGNYIDYYFKKAYEELKKEYEHAY